MTPPPSPPGVYRIIKSDDIIDSKTPILSIKDGDVTILAPGVVPDCDQEFRLESCGESGEAKAIQFPTKIWPSSSLSYEGEAEEFKRIILGPPRDFPSREWWLEPAAHFPGPRQLYFIRTLDKKFGINISPIEIYPPQLHLVKVGKDIPWVFELLSEK